MAVLDLISVWSKVDHIEEHIAHHWKQRFQFWKKTGCQVCMALFRGRKSRRHKNLHLSPLGNRYNVNDSKMIWDQQIDRKVMVRRTKLKKNITNAIKISQITLSVMKITKKLSQLSQLVVADRKWCHSMNWSLQNSGWSSQCDSSDQRIFSRMRFDDTSKWPLEWLNVVVCNDDDVADGDIFSNLFVFD